MKTLERLKVLVEEAQSISALRLSNRLKAKFGGKRVSHTSETPYHRTYSLILPKALPDEVKNFVFNQGFGVTPKEFFQPGVEVYETDHIKVVISKHQATGTNVTISEPKVKPKAHAGKH